MRNRKPETARLRRLRLEEHSNGGWTIWRGAESTIYAPDWSGGFTNTEDMLTGLREHLSETSEDPDGPSGEGD